MDNMTKHQSVWWRFVPTPLQASLFWLGAVVVLIGINFDLVLSAFGVSNLPIDQAAKDSYTKLLVFLGQYHWVNTLVLVIFWGLVALIANTMIWGVRNAITEVENEVIVDTQYTNVSTPRQRIKAPLIQFALSLLLLGLLVLTARYFFTYWVQNFRFLWLEFSGLKSVGLMLLNSLALALNILWLWELAKLVFLAD